MRLHSRSALRPWTRSALARAPCVLASTRSTQAQHGPPIASPTLPTDVSDALHHPPPTMGPIRLANIQGSGLGWEAEQPLHAGQLLMVCRPLAILHGRQAGDCPSGADLLAHLEQLQAQGALSTQQRAWLDVLQPLDHALRPADVAKAGAGEAGGAAAVAAARGQGEAEDTWRLRHVQRLMASEIAGDSGSTSAEARPSSGLSRELLARKLGANSYSNPCQDAAAMEARQIPPTRYPGGLVGLFPWFSFFNHSCSPNASYMVVCDDMVVRAVEGVAEGSEVTISYMGPRVLEPLEQRRAYLQAAYGFTCRCPRCRFEEALPAALSEFISTTFIGCEAVQQTAQAALENKEARTAYEMDRYLFEAWADLHRMASEMEPPVETNPNAEAAGGRGSAGPETPGSAAATTSSGGTDSGVSLQQLAWLEASLWRVLALQQGLFGYDLDPEAVAAAREVVRVVAAGSDLDVSLAVRQLAAAARLERASRQAAAKDKVRRRGPRGHRGGAGKAEEWEERVREAAEACVEVVTARYGAVSRATKGVLLGASLRQRLAPEEAQACLERLSAALTAQES